ncbi:MAG: YggS family pyridoxal phosphate-dependent enzyme [Pelovirga sp.]
MDPIKANIERIRQRIASACARCNRDPDSVRLVAVSKVKPAALIDEAFAAGQRLFGESYVQELRDKVEDVKSPVEWHFIGNLQSNKVKYLTRHVTLIHSVDRLSLAREISRQWGKLERDARILLQVNVGDETSKAGCAITDLEQLARAVARLPHLHICGLMCLPPFHEDPEQVRPYFKVLHDLAAALARQQIPGVRMDELSMGMSGDFEVAIEEGATLVRVGTAIFGERDSSR